MRRTFYLTTSVIAIATANVAADFVNFESAHVRPLALTPQGDFLYATNTPDNRVEIFRATEDGLRRAGEVVVGLEPVALGLGSPGELWVVNHLSDSVSVVDVRDPERAYVRETLLVGDEPRDIVFAGSEEGNPTRRYAFITTAHRGQNRPGDPQLTSPGVGRADVWVFDTADLSRPPHIVTLFCDTPRGLAVSPDGATVYAAAFHSGNRTTAIHELAVSDDPGRNGEIGDGFTGLGMPPLPEDLPNTTGRAPPETSIIVKNDGERWRDAAGRDWTPRVRLNLPDKDVFAIDATRDPPAEVGFASGVGTILFNLAVHPVSGRVYVSNLESNNHVRFEPKVRENIAQNRITIVDFGAESGPRVTPVHLNPHIDYSRTASSAEDVARSLSLPLALVFTADGERLYAAAFGSYRVAVLDAAGAVIERIGVGGGPSGLALDETRARLYVLNRWDETISIVDTEDAREVATVALRYDPEPPAVREGRRFLYDAAHSSGHGDSSCATCHVFADLDDLAWDLGDPQGTVLPNRTLAPALAASPVGLRPFHPMKGPMTTQSLRGLAGAGVLHWRGDRNGAAAGPNVFDERASFFEFLPAFEKLMGRSSAFPEEDMQKLFDFIITVRYPPNPIASLDGKLTEEQLRGRGIFAGSGDRNGDGGVSTSCTTCHTGPASTLGGSIVQNVQTQDFKIAHLRNLYTKVGMFGTPRPRIVKSPLQAEPVPTPHLGDQIRGFGFRHDGVLPSLFDLLREKSIARVRFPVHPDFDVAPGTPVERFKFLDQPGRSGDQRVRELEAFLLAFDTGLRPIVGQQLTVDQDTLERRQERLQLLVGRADARQAELVARGLFRGLDRGFLYARGGPFQSDRKEEVLTVEELLAVVRSGDAVLTFTAVPRGCGERIGLDRDGDGAYDRDELNQGSDPADPSSTAPADLRYRRGDTNADGTRDIADVVFALDHLFAGGAPPTCDKTLDLNDDGRGDVSDAVFLLARLFAGAAQPPEPFGGCGLDPTPDVLTCDSFAPCE